MIVAILNGPEVERLRQAFAYLRVVAALSGDEQVQAKARDLEKRIMVALAAADSEYRAATLDGLTPREIDVLALVAIGWKNGEIGAGIGLGAETVKSYLRNVMGKLGVHSRQDAVRAGRTAGCIP